MFTLYYLKNQDITLPFLFHEQPCAVPKMQLDQRAYDKCYIYNFVHQNGFSFREPVEKIRVYNKCTPPIHGKVNTN